MPDRFIRLREVTYQTGCSKTKLYNMIAAGTFPKPIKLGAGANAGSAWLESSVQRWIQQRVADSADQDNNAA